MRICVSPSSVTNALRLLASAIIALLLHRKFVEQFVEHVEALVPCPLVPFDPVVHVLERRRVQSIEPLPPIFARLHETNRAENAQVLRDLRLREPERVDQLVDRALPTSERVEYFPASGLRDRVERVRRRSCSRHGSNICLYQHMSTLRFYPGSVREPAIRVRRGARSLRYGARRVR